SCRFYPPTSRIQLLPPPTRCSTDHVYSTENVILFRDKGQPKAQNVTTQLTTMVVQDLSGGTTRIGIFDPLLYQYFWDYDNNGLRSEEHTSELQSRFDLVCRLLLEIN